MKKLFLIFITLFIFSNFHSLAEVYYRKLFLLPPSELIRLGDYYLQQEHPDTAMEFYMAMADQYNEKMDKPIRYLCALACNSIGQLYYQKENYSKAYNFYLKGLQICEANDFDDLFPRIHMNIGTIHGVFMDYEQSISYYEKALSYARGQKNLEIEIKSLENLIGSCCLANQTQRAKIYYKQLMNYPGKNKQVEYFSYYGKAQILMNEEKYDSAYLYYKKTVNYADRMKLDAIYKGVVYSGLARLFESTMQNDSALYYSRINVEFTKDNGLMYILVRSLKTLIRLYEKQGEHQKAQQYKEYYWSISDSLFNINEFNRMKDIRFTYEMDKNYHQIISLTTDKEQKEFQIKTQRKILFTITGSFIAFIILSMIVYIQKKKLSSAYKNLFARSNEILQSEKQNKELRRCYENKLAEIERETVQSPSEHNDPLPKYAEAEIVAADDGNLYATSNLTEKSKKELLQSIHRIMENPDEFCDCEFTLNRLSMLVNSNSSYVSQVINETYNKNFRAFINEYRIREAQVRLMDTERYGNYTIQAIAGSVGYKSHTNFILIFKRMTGMNPSIFQKIAKEKK